MTIMLLIIIAHTHILDWVDDCWVKMLFTILYSNLLHKLNNKKKKTISFLSTYTIIQ